MFSPIPTNLESFRDHLWIPGGALAPHEEAPLPMKRLRSAALALGWTVTSGLCAAAEPGGPVCAADYASIRDQLLEDLRNAMPVDAVALCLHGGMVAAGALDCEGDILARVRAIVGPDTPVGAILDPHANLTRAMIEMADLLIFFKEYPHTDIGECADQLVCLLTDCATQRIRPVPSVFNCRMIDFYFTDREPMRGFVDDMRQAENADGVLSVSLIHGFPWVDAPAMGTKMLVYTDGRPEAGMALARSFGERLFAARGATRPALLTVEEAVARARQASDAPLVLADVADNPGGGAPGDSTWLIGALVEAGIEGVLAGGLWDPQLVRRAMALGAGGETVFRIGGKTSPFSGPPLDLKATVLATRRAAVQCADEWEWPIGDAVLLRAGGLDLVATELRTQCLDPSLFTALGADPAAARVIVVKSAQHFIAGFGPLTSRIAYVASPGVLTLTVDPARYAHLSRPMWPFDANPFTPTAETIPNPEGPADNNWRESE